MKLKCAIIACSSLILVAATSFVRSAPTGPTPVVAPENRELRQPPSAESQPSIGRHFPGLPFRTRRKAEGGNGEAPPGQEIVPTKTLSQESKHLKDIAAKLSITVPDDDSPDNIAFLIKRLLDNSERYRGAVLSDDSAKDVKAQILEQSDAETFADYHSFIKKVAGKRILILETDE